MNNPFYFKLAKTNLKENWRIYRPYITACICTVMMFYIMDCINLNKEIYEKLEGISTSGLLKFLISAGVNLIGIFSVIFLFYTNSFLIKRRKKEIGIYNVVGMEKRHISIVLSIETLIIATASLILGILGGIIIGKLIFLILLNLLRVDIHLSSSFSISLSAVINTIELFALIFLVILVANIVQIKNTRTIDLLKGSRKESKTSWILTISGIIELAFGYGIALNFNFSIESLSKIYYVFAAVILVILGTYSTIIGGSIVFLKLLKKNKKLFYKTKNFVSISGMIYRMKQNAVGLASICILTTAVILTISTTVSLYVGQEKSLRLANPFDAHISIKNATSEEKDKVKNILQEEAKENNISLKNNIEESGKGMAVLRSNNSFTSASNVLFTSTNDPKVIGLYLLDDYNKIENRNISLEDNEVLIFSVGKEYNYDSIIINDNEFKVKEKIDKLNTANKITNDLEGYFVIVKDKDIIKNIYKDTKGNSLENLDYYNSFNIDGNKEDISRFCNTLKNTSSSTKEFDFGSIFFEREEANIKNGGFIFIGSFLGILLTIGTALIIYYKQISEGYDDRDRFKVMQKAGMSNEDIKGTINKQMLIMFFLPLVVSIIHIAFALKFLIIVLTVFGLFDLNIFFICITVTIVIFAALSGIFYRVTANTYYKIVQQ
ncbi:ABC transporter permease [Clostridium beijerinckii]|uniref:ABC transporter permease n=1 Tax=Clostridium beijerinckii TaxID=1520 RepID=UPI00047A0DF7|nr:FtsX-like permease family protein [Clostridium beijerinckii]